MPIRNLARTYHLLIPLLAFLVLPATAQLVTVSESFRIVQVDRDERRLGVANLDADPHVRQNWVNLKDSTRVILDGEQQAVLSEALSTLRKGDVIRVHGGRNWTGKITAKTIRLVEDGGTDTVQTSTAENLAVKKQPVDDGSPRAAVEEAVVPYKQTQWSGKVQEVTAESVILETSRALIVLPRGLNYDGELAVGQTVSAVVPSGSGELVSANAETLILRGADGLYQIPISSVSDPQVQVPVLTPNGNSTSLPLETAMKLQSQGNGSILAPEFHQVESEILSEGSGVVLNATPDLVLVGTAGGRVVRLPATSSIRIGQPVSFGRGYVNSLDHWKRGGGNFKFKGKKIKF